MLSDLLAAYTAVAKWLNENQGVVGVGIFGVTLLIGWLSGIFSALRRRPKLKLSLIEGPTFVCTYPVGKKHGDFDVHRTGVALYLRLANIGSAATSIGRISVGYHWNVLRFTRVWVRYGLGWFWLHDQIAAIHDFQVKIGENLKIFPFLTQASTLASTRVSSFLEPGQIESGVVYFEQSDSWGGCFPSAGRKGVQVRVAVADAFGRKHVATFDVPSVSFADARKFNPSFGKALAELHGRPLPADFEPTQPESAAQ